MSRSRPTPVDGGLAAVPLVVLALCTALGGWRAAIVLAGPAQGSTIELGGVTYTVTHVEQVKGLTDQDLGGMAHGVQSLVTDDNALVTVSLVVSSDGGAHGYDTGILRAVEQGTSVTLRPVGSTLAPGHLRPHARVEGAVSFVVKRDGAQLLLRAPGSGHDVPLIRVPMAAAGSGEHHHDSTTPTTGHPVAPAPLSGRRSP